MSIEKKEELGMPPFVTRDLKKTKERERERGSER